MEHQFIQLAQSVTGAVVTIVLLLLVAAIIGYLTAWYYAKSVYTPKIKALEAEKSNLLKLVDDLRDESKKQKDTIAAQKETIGSLEARIASLDEELKGMAGGRFVVSKAKDGQTYFNLKTDEGSLLLKSEMYTTRSACNNGIESVRKNCSEEKRYERKLTADSRHFFNLKATNGQVIGTSDFYDSEDSMEKGIASVMKMGKTNTIDDTTA
ncbi:MAG: YegP family protein [Bacteroidales bacterium]|jgi:hypothetical protein|nr:YegP family protein [Bacteroidales bacterium]